MTVPRGKIGGGGGMIDRPFVAVGREGNGWGGGVSLIPKVMYLLV